VENSRAGQPASSRSSLAAAQWAAVALLVLGFIAPLWWAALLPAEDLPVHLAYARIIRDHAEPLVAAEYTVAAEAQPYFTTYRLLAALGRAMPLLAAARLLFTVYVLGLFAAVFFLARVAHRDEPRRLPPAALFAVAPMVWSPVAAMGFLPFVLTVPLLVVAAALVLWAKERPIAAGAALVVTSALAISLHVFAAPCLIAIALLVAAAVRERPVTRAALVTVAAVPATLALWALFGELGLGSSSAIDWRESLRRTAGLDFVTAALRISWGTPPLKLTYAGYALFGPYGALGQLVAMIGALAVALVARPFRSSRLWRAAALFGALGFVIPWGIYAPSEMTHLDLRAMSVAAVLVAALLPPFAAPRARLALMVFGLAVCAHLQLRFASFSRSEAVPLLRVLERARAAPRLAFLSFDGSAPGWGYPFRVTQHLPFHHTVLSGGINTQLWGRYTAHLPVEHRTPPVATPVWEPWEFQPAHLAGVQALLVQAPGPTSDPRAAPAFDKLPALIADSFRRDLCAGRYCLFLRFQPERP
jgi:hypothetical protein